MLQSTSRRRNRQGKPTRLSSREGGPLEEEYLMQALRDIVPPAKLLRACIAIR